MCAARGEMDTVGTGLAEMKELTSDNPHVFVFTLLYFVVYLLKKHIYHKLHSSVSRIWSDVLSQSGSIPFCSSPLKTRVRRPEITAVPPTPALMNWVCSLPLIRDEVQISAVWSRRG